MGRHNMRDSWVGGISVELIIREDEYGYDETLVTVSASGAGLLS